MPNNNSVIRMIRDEYPAYDPAAFACEKAGITLDTFHAAMARVYHDGYYGPISDADWREQDGREPSNVDDALKILSKIADEIEDYRHEVYETDHVTDEEGQMVDAGGILVTDWIVDAADIRSELFSEIYKIWGKPPWR